MLGSASRAVSLNVIVSPLLFTCHTYDAKIDARVSGRTLKILAVFPGKAHSYTTCLSDRTIGLIYSAGTSQAKPEALIRLLRSPPKGQASAGRSHCGWIRQRWAIMTKYFRRIWISLVSEATIGAPGGLRQAGPEGPWGGCPSGSGRLDGAKG